MKFVIDPIIDYERRKLRDSYDETFNKIRDCAKKTPEHTILLRELLKKERLTKRFLKANSYYFNRKKEYVFRYLEIHGVFGEKPSFDNSNYGVNRYTHSVPLKIKKNRICSECGKSYLWYEERPTAMCRECRTIND